MSFQQGLSGLNSSSKALDTIGNNVANAGTVGFKSATAQFADVYAASLGGGGGASQVGIGSALSRVAQNFTQGNVTNTNNPLDMAINGAGLYRMANPDGTISYTRAGQFQLDKSGFITNANGMQLTGYKADPVTGTISPGNLLPLQVINTNIAPRVTSTSKIALNLDSRALPPTAMSSGMLTGANPLVGTITIANTNDTLNLVVDGNPVSVQLPQKDYTATDLASTLQLLLNTKLGPFGASVSVSSNTAGQMTITSDSKGSLGSAGFGSAVTLNGLGGTAASTLLGAPTTAAGTAVVPASLSAGTSLPSSVTIGTGESFTFTTTVGGVQTTKTISLTPGTYATTDGPPSTFEKQLQTDFNSAFGAAAWPAIGPVTVTASTQTQATMKLALTAAGAGDTVNVGTMTSGVQSLFGPTNVVGADNFNTISASTAGTLTSGAPLTTVDLTGGANVLNINIDGHALSNINLTAKVYTAGAAAPNGLADLAADLQAKINGALVALGPSVMSRVTVSVNSSNEIVVTSSSSGNASSITLAGTGGTAGTPVFGAKPTALPGSQTQSISPVGYTASTAQTVYDSQGNPHSMSLYFVKTSQGNVWQMYSTIDGAQQQGPLTMTFDGSGALQSPPMPLTMPGVGNSYTFNASSTNASKPNPLQFKLDLTGTTQYGVNFAVNTLTQDGYSSGQLSGISVSSNGTIQGRFSNGQSKNMGQIVLVSFNNSNGLQSLGGNQWAESTESGQPIPGAPGTGSLGLIQSASVEESNVDLTKELVDMITQQRVYQANAQTIKTQDSVLQTLVNMR